MPPVSPYLDELLTRWHARGRELRKDIDFQKSLLEPMALAAHGNRLALRERRRRDVHQLEESVQQSHERWTERLNRIEKWEKAVAGLREETRHYHELILSTSWLQKARSHQDRFIQGIRKRAIAIHASQQYLRAQLALWEPLLEARELSLQELAQKAQNLDRTLYVSRARKKPEIEFAQEQQAASEALGLAMQSIRHMVQRLAGRLAKAFAAVERRSAGADLLYEAHKVEIISALKESERMVQNLRDEILTDALSYEGCRNRLRKICTIAQDMNCIEDLPQPPESAWKAFLKIH